ncbi:putative Peroxidase 2 [Hibiscus syriacus]|uniref:peroxidase n=1 Tax=Hibiscus syriacus TaxID=106335 RepID=A0A6A2Z8D4_HIBSY|nr:putative Peroxidase 2 [Hibiscus syriacus]
MLKRMFGVQVEGQSWKFPLGRMDSRIAHLEGIGGIPTQHDSLANIAARFESVGLDSTDLVTLSGVHTFGRAQYAAFMDRLYNFNNVSGEVDPTLNATFDNKYFLNLQNRKGLLQSDQELFSTNGAETVAIVNRFTRSQSQFFASFAKAMIKVGNITP